MKIAIDGYSSCGKSTLAKALAKQLNYLFVDSGAMYRAVTLYFLEHGIPVSDLNNDHINVHLEKINVTFEFNDINNAYEVCLNGKNVEKEIRNMDVSENVSTVSTIKSVRRKLVLIQQQLGKNKNVVMDGRDIGTVVFPDAELKIFMTADVNERARRRFKELTDKNIKTTLEEVKENISQRDYNDTHRSESPLLQAKDAIILDNTNLSPAESLKYVLDTFLKLPN